MRENEREKGKREQGKRLLKVKEPRNKQRPTTGSPATTV